MNDRSNIPIILKNDPNINSVLDYLSTVKHSGKYGDVYFCPKNKLFKLFIEQSEISLDIIKHRVKLASQNINADIHISLNEEYVELDNEYVYLGPYGIMV